MQQLPSNRSMLFSALLIMLMGSLVFLPGCGQSDKEKAMDLADQYEELIDKYSDELKSQKENNNMAGMMETLGKLQEESMALMEQFDGLDAVLSEEDKAEVEKRFTELAQKLTEIMMMQ